MTGPELRTLRELIRFTPTEFAVALNCTADHVSAMERSEDHISDEMEYVAMRFAYYVRSLRGVAV